MNQTARFARTPRSFSARAAWLLCAMASTGFVAGGAAGCGSEADSGIEAGVVKDSDSAVIVGSVDWQEAAALPANSAQRQNANVVAYLNIPTLGQRCTGFLIAPDVVMTNHHCIPQAQAAQGVVASFGYEAGSQNLRQFTLRPVA